MYLTNDGKNQADIATNKYKTRNTKQLFIKLLKITRIENQFSKSKIKPENNFIKYQLLGY